MSRNGRWKPGLLPGIQNKEPPVWPARSMALRISGLPAFAAGSCFKAVQAGSGSMINHKTAYDSERQHLPGIGIRRESDGLDKKT